MCRLLAVAAPAPRPVEDVVGTPVMRAFSRMSRFHRDGWGAAWLDDESAVRVARSTSPAREDRDFAERASAASRATLLHLRWASTGMDVTGLNTHPFQHDGVAFAHNGFIAPAATLDAVLPADSRALLRGTTDSERYASLVHHYRATGCGLADAVALAAERLRELFPQASLNAVALDSRTLVVVRASAHAIPDTAAMRAGGMTARNALASHLDGGYYRMSFKRLADGAIAFSSSGIPRDGWEPLPDETLTEVSLATGAVERRELSATDGAAALRAAA